VFGQWEDERLERANEEALGVRGPDTVLGDDYWRDYCNYVIEGPGSAALPLVLKFCEAAPDDDALCWVGVNFIAPLLDLHWERIGEGFLKAASGSRNVRKAFSCAAIKLKPTRRGGCRARSEARGGHRARRHRSSLNQEIVPISPGPDFQ
jgi:hypothetical protein